MNRKDYNDIRRIMEVLAYVILSGEMMIIIIGMAIMSFMGLPKPDPKFLIIGFALTIIHAVSYVICDQMFMKEKKNIKD